MAAALSRTLRIATRRSPLALWQAEHVRDRLLALHAGLQVELLPMSTQGDRILDAPLAKVGGKGLFVKELENGLLDGSADLAVHSMKDVPMHLPPGLALPVVCAREDPRDAFVSNRHGHFSELEIGARVGTASLRRRCQLLYLRPDLQVSNLRGNVNTRLGKLDAGEFDAIVLACAGLKRLGLAARIRDGFDPGEMLPAVGQGVLGIECREDDEELHALLAPLHDERSALCVASEREVNRQLGGGCQAPIACHAVLHGDQLDLEGLVGAPDGSRVIFASAAGQSGDASDLCADLVRQLRDQGAEELLEALRGFDGW